VSSVSRSVAPIQVFSLIRLFANVCSAVVVNDASSADCVQTQLVLAASQLSLSVISL